MKSKTIILSADSEQGRGILTLYEEDDLLKCKIRLYNIKPLNRYCKLGIYHNREVFSANLLEKNGAYHSSFVGDFDINGDFFCAIVDTSNENSVIISGGTYSGYYFNNQTEIFDKIEKENPQTNLMTYEDIESNVETIIDQELEDKEKEDCKGDCKHCKYKEYFYSMQENVESSTKQDLALNQGDISTPLHSAQYNTCYNEKSTQEFNATQNKEQTPTKQGETANIIGALIPQFDYVFNNYKADERLNALIVNSKFVKIEENQEEYSIGAIYEEDKMKYICYAVFSEYNSPAPSELGKHYQWLPIDKSDPLSDGYYIVFQDANDLKIVEI